MLFNESPDDSGYPRKAFIQVQDARRTSSALLDMISGLGINRDKGNNASTADAFYEAYQWFTGGKVHMGNKTATKHDTAAFTDATQEPAIASPGLGLRAATTSSTSPTASRRTTTTAALALLQRL